MRPGEPVPLTVLVVEDDAPLRSVLEAHLTDAGWAVRAAGDYATGRALALEVPPDLALLDINLPDGSGLALLGEVRARYGTGPGVLLLTGLGEEDDVIAGLDAGADDYVVKPCRPREVVARLGALARRAAGVLPGARARAITEGDLSVDLDAHRAAVAGRVLELTVMEFSLLRVLVSEPERVFPRLELLTLVWGTQVAGYARNVDCHVARLRKKLADAGARPVPIRTVRGVGYAFRAEGP